jgi:membrane protein involved in colicin uptake
MSDLTREQVEAFTNGQREPISNECDLATQLLATMDALTTAETERGKALKVWAEQVKRAEKATERANIAEARIEAERDAAHDAIRWALGEGDSDFGDDPHNGAFWWRKPLRDKAGLVWSAGRCRSVTPDELLDRAALNDREDG